jgi:gamma-glutamylaminecyclotransferase
MCLIIHNPKGKDISDEILDNAMYMNPDGFGIFFHDTKETIHTMKWDETYDLLNIGRPYTAHFRYATSGLIGKKSCHPFVIDDTFSLMMNGTIERLVSAKTVDTVALCKILKGMSERKMLDVLSTYACRFALINRVTGNVKIVNRDLWFVRDGVHYSKDTCFPTARKTPYHVTSKSSYSLEQEEIDREWDEWLAMEQEYTDDWSVNHTPVRVVSKEVCTSVAVYGTLKEGCGNHRLLSTSQCLGSGYTSDPYPLVVDNLPYMIDRKGKGKRVSVEIYRVTDDTLARLDGLEGHPDWYQRKQIQVQLYKGGTVTAWVYMIPDSKSTTHMNDTGVYVDCY